MTHAVLVQKVSSGYDDRLGEWYHFPKGYLNRMKQTVGDWVCFYSPVKDRGVVQEARGAYYAVARIERIDADPKSDKKYYAYFEHGSFASFANVVSRNNGMNFVEPSMGKDDGTLNSGMAGQSVRLITPEIFDYIINSAWREDLPELPRTDLKEDSSIFGVSEERVPFAYDVDREIVISLSNRKVRDCRFRLAILNAYQKKCAITGWSFVNGGGRAEAEAAHIKPVEHDGPDSINNGLALSGTVHWMFDRGLLSVANDDSILISRKVNDPDRIRALINPTMKLLKPIKQECHPHPAFLKWHRQFHGFEAA